MKFQAKSSILSLQRQKALVGFNDIPIALVGIPVLGFLMPLLFFDGSLDAGLVAYWPKWKVAMFFSSIYWVMMRWTVVLFRLQFPEYRDTRKRVVLMLIATVLLVLVINSFCYEIHGFLLPHGHTENLTLFHYGRSTLMVVLFIISIYEGVYLYHRWRLSLLETEQLRRENIQSQLEGLKNQVNPHFLFNSLNTLTYLIPEDSGRAVSFVQQLSKVYRYILEIRDRELITLDEELDFMGAYVFLLKERFGDNLQLNIQIDPAVRNLHMVPLSMQMLLENAIKHNIISKDQPLAIEIAARAKENTLTIRNKLQLKRQTHTSTKVGLENIRRRYAFYTTAEVLAGETDGWFMVSIPLLHTAETMLQQKTVV